MISLDDLINISNIQIGYLTVSFAAFILYRIFMCLTIFADSKERQIGHKMLWSLLTLIFGAFIPIIYAVINRNKKKKQLVKSKKIFLIIAMILLVVSFCGRMLFDLSNTVEFGYLLNPNIAFLYTDILLG